MLNIGNLALSFLTIDTIKEYVMFIYALRMFGIFMTMMHLTTSGSIGTSIIITIMSKTSASSNISKSLKATVHGMNMSFLSIAVLTLIGVLLAFFVIKSIKLVWDN